MTGIYIDDTGTPSLKSKSRYDTGDWKTWVAVLLDSKQRLQLDQQLTSLNKNYQARFGISEFHFTEIFSGKGNLRKLSIEERLGIFKIFSDLYKYYAPEVIIQSFTSDDIIRNRMEFQQYLKFDGFDFSILSDMALWHLLKKTKDHILKKNYQLPVEIFIDSGRQKPNTKQKINLLNGITANSEVNYIDSKDDTLIQFIDFIAFSLNRMRWILMNDKKSKFDFQFIKIISDANFQVVNLKRRYYDFNQVNVSDYDKNLREKYDKNKNLSDEEVERIKKSRKK